MLFITYTLLLVLGVALKRDPAQSIAFYHELHEKAALAHLEQPALAHLDDQTPTTPTVPTQPTVAAAPAKPFLDLQTPTTPTELAHLATKPAPLATKPGAPLAVRASCHDMAAAGECETNKVYMLSQCVLACQAVAAGGVAARPAPAAAAALPVTKPHLGLHAPTAPTETPSVAPAVAAVPAKVHLKAAEPASVPEVI
jgi:hypothetical protein